MLQESKFKLSKLIKSTIHQQLSKLNRMIYYLGHRLNSQVLVKFCCHIKDRNKQQQIKKLEIYEAIRIRDISWYYIKQNTDYFELQSNLKRENRAR